jgi:hypothetical protein
MTGWAGIPVLGQKADGSSGWIADTRWVDVRGSFAASSCRFGGEEGGLPICHHFTVANSDASGNADFGYARRLDRDPRLLDLCRPRGAPGRGGHRPARRGADLDRVGGQHRAAHQPDRPQPRRRPQHRRSGRLLRRVARGGRQARREAVLRLAHQRLPRGAFSIPLP